MKCEACRNEINPLVIAKHMEKGQCLCRCPECELIFVNPLPEDDEIKGSNDGMYADLAESFSTEKYTWAKKSVGEYLAQAKRLNGEIKTCLDLGGGLGYYSRAMSELGVDVTLVELDPVSASFASKHHTSVTVRQCDVAELVEAGLMFDLILFRHTIEHVERPSEIVEVISKLLNDNGVLIVETPNNKAFEFLIRPSTHVFFRKIYKKFQGLNSTLRILKARVYAIDPPRHLHCFTIDNLSRLLRSNSIMPKKSFSYRMGHPIYWPNIRIDFRDLYSLNAIKTVLCIIEAFLLPIRVVMQAFGYGSGICIYAQKDS